MRMHICWSCIWKTYTEKKLVLNENKIIRYQIQMTGVREGKPGFRGTTVNDNELTFQLKFIASCLFRIETCSPPGCAERNFKVFNFFWFSLFVCCAADNRSVVMPVAVYLIYSKLYIYINSIIPPRMASYQLF